MAELGFMSNESEYTRLISSKYQTRIAEAIANGVNSYLSGTNSAAGTGGTDDSASSSSSSSDELSLSDDVLNLDSGGHGGSLGIRGTGRYLEIEIPLLPR
jgi:hypothetical protein